MDDMSPDDRAKAVATVSTSAARCCKLAMELQIELLRQYTNPDGTVTLPEDLKALSRELELATQKWENIVIADSKKLFADMGISTEHL